jgi:hypothetical protein
MASAYKYQNAMQLFARLLLKYFVEPETAKRVGFTRAGIDQIPPEQYVPLLDLVYNDMRAYPGTNDPNSEDRREYERYLNRCLLRLRTLSQLSSTIAPPPTTGPTTTAP